MASELLSFSNLGDVVAWHLPKVFGEPEGRMLAKLGNTLGMVADRRMLAGLAALGCGVLFGSLEYGIMRGMVKFGLPSELQSTVDAGIITLGTGIFAWVMLAVHRVRRKRVRDEIARIAELNHQVRNALQVIADTQYAKGEHRDLVLQSVSRIDCVLKQLFPMVGSGRGRMARRDPASWFRIPVLTEIPLAPRYKLRHDSSPASGGKLRDDDSQVM